MKIVIEYLECGLPGSIIDCHHASFQCAFCKEYGSWFSETRDVSPQQLVQLIRGYKYIIKTK